MHLSISIFFLILTQFLYSQEDSVTTVLISSLSTPDQLSTLIQDASARGIILDIDQINWNDKKDRIAKIDFSVQFAKYDGSLTGKTIHNFRYNELNEGSILLLLSGSTYNNTIVMNNRQLFEGCARNPQE